MKRSLFYLLVACSCELALAQASDVSSLSQSQALLEEQTRIENLMADIESDYGPYDVRLLEPLESLAELYLSSEEFTELESVYSRQLQIMRADRGLDHPDNIPIVRSILRNQIQQGEWSEVSDSLAHIRYLQGVNSDSSPDALIAAITEQADWLMARIYLDEPRYRARNLLEVRELFEDVEDLVEERYGEESLEMAPVLYRQALINYQLVAFLNSTNSLGSETIDRLVQEDGIGRLQLSNVRGGIFSTGLIGNGINIPVVDGNSLIGESYLREGLSKIDDIRDLFEALDNQEALAMANIAYGDFQVLLGRSSGYKSYAEAQELLLNASVSRQAIDEYFQQPQVIPMETLPLTFDQALLEKTEQNSLVEGVDSDAIFLGEFISLEESAAIVRMSDAVRSFGFSEPSNVVDLKFNISSRGVTSSVRVLDAQPNQSFVRRNAAEAIKRMQFRPLFDGQKTKRVRGATIRYRFDE